MITAIFNPDTTMANAYGLWQWDYGQILRIQGLNLPSMVEIHFSLQETGGTSVSRVGITKDGVTDVVIPDSMLQNDGAASDYDIFVFVYLTDDTSGQTEYKIKLRVKSRPEPEVPSGGEEPDIFHDAVQAVQKSADKAAESERQAEGWAHGREDLPERAQDNAKYYSDQTAADAKKTGTDRKEVERLVESVSGIDEQVQKVEDLTKQAQTSATNAALSEQTAKTAETNAQTAQAGAETAEGNAELAERNAKVSEQAVEKAKQLVTQMGQEVLNNKKHVDQTTQAFTLTAQQAVADVNNAGQAQTERVEGAGNTAVESVKAAQTSATKAVETAKAEAVEAVQTEGTTQTGNVSAEGEKQVQAVQAAAQEIIADREQIQSNKEDIAELRQNKADAIVETASGEMIQIGDSSGAAFEGMRIFGKSTQNGVPTLDNPVSIESAGDNGEIKCNVSGKNLLNCYKLAESEPTYYSTEQGELKIIQGNSDAWTLLPEYGTLAAGTYTVSGDNAEVRNAINNISLAMCDYNRKPVSFTLNEDTIVKIKVGYGRDKYPYISNAMMNAGEIITEYEPYRPIQQLTLPTPNGLPGIKVDSGGNYTDSTGQQWVCDEIDLTRGKYVQRIGRKNFKDMTWKKHPVSGTIEGRFYSENVLDIKMSNTPDIQFDALSNKFPSPIDGNVLFNTSVSAISIYREEGEKIFAKIVGVTELEEFVSKTNDAYIIYQLATPIETDLPPEVLEAYKQLHTNYPTTVITNDSEAGMEVSYVADTKHYIASKIETPLQKQITDLQNALINQKISGGV